MQLGREGLSRTTKSPQAQASPLNHLKKSVVSCSCVPALLVVVGGVSLVGEHPLLVADDSLLSLTCFEISGCHGERMLCLHGNQSLCLTEALGVVLTLSANQGECGCEVVSTWCCCRLPPTHRPCQPVLPICQVTGAGADMTWSPSMCTVSYPPEACASCVPPEPHVVSGSGPSSPFPAYTPNYRDFRRD
jgi:hypothetical protein